MIPRELFQKIKQIEITTNRLVTDVFAGQYHSVFKGQGIEFDEVREYNFGDDIRFIDWNVTARTGKTHIKKFVEERELTVMIMVDVSASSQFASREDYKSQLAANISALVALSAIRNNDKVGLIIFSDNIEKFIPPRKGRQHVLRVIREILYFKPTGKATDICMALDYLNRVSSRKTISFLISDFFDDQNASAHDYMQSRLKRTLAIANKRHDLIAVALSDPLELHMPKVGLIQVEDAESGELITIDTSDAHFQKNYSNSNQQRIRQRDLMFRSVGIDFINISTIDSYVDEIVKFFLLRRKRQRR